MDVHMLHFYPDLMNLYGSYANISVLKRCLEVLGCTVTVSTVKPGEDVHLQNADFLYMGAGTERSAAYAAGDMQRYREELSAAANDGTVMLFAGTAMELLGQSVTDAGGHTFPGAGLAGFTSVQDKKRRVGDVYGHTDLYPEAVVGFMNKCAVIKNVETPLLAKLDMGWGNEAQNSPEGFHWKNVFASELTGPLLVKNPKLLETVAAAVYARRGLPLPVDHPSGGWSEKAYTVTEEQLRLRVQRR